MKLGKKKVLLLISLAILALVGATLFLSQASSSIVSPFLLARSYGQKKGEAPYIDTYPSVVTTGKMMTITGKDFSSLYNKITIDGKKIDTVRSFEHGTILVFEIPSTKHFESGTYELFVRTASGTSNSVSATVR